MTELPRPAAASARVGARASTAQESRCRKVATCESQHETEQNTSCVLARLQVETLQTQCVAPNGMPFRHALHCNHTSAASSAMAAELIAACARQVVAGR